MTSEPTTPADEGTMRRLKKLLALAMDPGAAPGEAANAMRMAQRLMEKHGVTEGVIAKSEIDEFTYTSTKATTPPPWEGRLIAELCRAFGARCYWKPGMGFRGARDKGNWVVLAEKRQLPLIQYAFDVIRRQMIRDRAAHVAKLPAHWTRPRKAMEGDAFGLGFIAALSTKISTFADQDTAIAKALEDRVNEVCGGKKLKRTTNNGSLLSQLAGAEAGQRANLHRPMSGAAERLKIGA